MAEFPALPFFTDAFIGDTTHLTAEETGAYLMLLFIEWRTDDCTLPDDDKILARYARTTFQRWLNIRSTVMSFFQKDSNGRWFQRRLVDEKKYVIARRNKNIEAGRASALKRKNRHSTTVITERQPKLNQPLTPNPLSKKEPLRGKKKVRLEEVTEEMLSGWVKEKITAPINIHYEIECCRVHPFKREVIDGVATMKTWLLKAQEYYRQNNQRKATASEPDKNGVRREGNITIAPSGARYKAVNTI